MLSKKKQCHLLFWWFEKLKKKYWKLVSANYFLLISVVLAAYDRQNLVLYKEVVFLILEFSFATKESLNLSLKFLLGHST